MRDHEIGVVKVKIQHGLPEKDAAQTACHKDVYILPRYNNISYLLAATTVFLVLRFHLLPAVFAGLAVYVLTLKLARHLPKNMNRFAHKLALGVVVVSVISCLTSAGAVIWSFIGSSHGIAALLATVLDTLGSL